MATSTLPTADTATDTFPINGTDYIEFYVGNAKQASLYYRAAFGFQLVAYRGPETGVRDRASYLLQQGKIRFVLTSPIRADLSGEAAPPVPPVQVPAPSALVITASDAAAAGVRADASGPLVAERLARLGFVVERALVPDERARISAAIAEGAEEAVLNALFNARSVTTDPGRHGDTPFPLERLDELTEAATARARGARRRRS